MINTPVANSPGATKINPTGHPAIKNTWSSCQKYRGRQSTTRGNPAAPHPTSLTFTTPHRPTPPHLTPHHPTLPPHTTSPHPAAPTPLATEPNLNGKAGNSSGRVGDVGGCRLGGGGGQECRLTRQGGRLSQRGVAGGMPLTAAMRDASPPQSLLCGNPVVFINPERGVGDMLMTILPAKLRHLFSGPFASP
jgi:hypothetical protein